MFRGMMTCSSASFDLLHLVFKQDFLDFHLFLLLFWTLLSLLLPASSLFCCPYFSMSSLSHVFREILISVPSFLPFPLPLFSLSNNLTISKLSSFQRNAVPLVMWSKTLLDTFVFCELKENVASRSCIWMSRMALWNHFVK